MNLPKYKVIPNEIGDTYTFVSEGKKGMIYKIISFQEIEKGLYNLGFGDMNPITKELDDKVVSNNGDTEKVLSSVVSAIYAFTEKFPEAWIYAEGSTPSRTRLYQMNIVKYFDLVEKDFELQCLLNQEWEDFRPNINYEAFVIKRKRVNYDNETK